MRLITCFLAIVLLAACSDSKSPASCDALVFEDAWIREAPPGATVLAGYGNIQNPADTAVQILSANSQYFGKIEFHHTRSDSGMMKMEKLTKFTAPAQGNLILAPGAQHMMLFKPSGATQVGDRIDISFDCSTGSTTATFDVRSMQHDGPGSAHGAHIHH